MNADVESKDNVDLSDEQVHRDLGASQSYGDDLPLNQLLSAQQPVSSQHYDMLFLVNHQSITFVVTNWRPLPIPKSSSGLVGSASLLAANAVLKVPLPGDNVPTRSLKFTASFESVPITSSR